MLATPWDTPFSDPGWVFELKWDGVRCLMSSTGPSVQTTSRAGNDLAGRYPELVGVDLPADTVLDGEVVALDENGLPSFERLQARMSAGRSRLPITYVVFDLLHRKAPMVHRPLEERMEALRELELPSPIVVADRFHGDSQPVWDFVVANDIEGIVAKRLGSTYQSGRRSADWRKIGQFKQMCAVVGGFTVGTGGRESTFGALLLGLATGDRLRWIGAVGSGFDDKSLRSIRSALDEMTVPDSPFQPDTDLPAGSTWVEPQLVAMVRYKQWTAAGRVRAPSFKGFTDTAPELATWEAEGPG
ncbi:MAG: hypothetical protein GY926_01255 [bacterium]|nr:hypothetical protein [bacterium]MCP4963842.1 hypothetical protein [bacterium]